MDSKKFNSILLVIGLALLIFLVANFDFSALKNFSFSFTFINISVLILLIFVIFIIRTIRWMWYLKSIHVNLSFKDAYLITVPSIAVALFTPAQSGDLLKIEFLKKRKNILRRDSFSTIFVEKLMDLLLIFIIFLIAISYFSLRSLNINYFTITVAVLIGIIIFSILTYFLYQKYEIMKPIVENTKKILKDPKTMTYALILTLLYWIATGLNWWYVAKVVNVDVTFFQILAVMSISTIIGLVSFVPGALGVMEYSSIFILTTFLAVSANHAIIFALSYRLYAVLMYIVAYAHLMFKSE